MQKSPDLPVVSFNTSGTQICFLFFVVFTGTGTDPPSAVSVCQFSVTPANRQPQHKDEKQRENT